MLATSWLVYITAKPFSISNTGTILSKNMDVYVYEHEGLFNISFRHKFK